MPRKKKTTEVDFIESKPKRTRKPRQKTTRKTTAKPTAPTNHVTPMAPTSSAGLYRKIAVTFVVLTVLLAAAVVYFSLVSVKIVIYPNKERTTADFTARVVNEGAGATAGEASVPGRVAGVQLTVTDTFPATGKQTENVTVGGTVTVINNSSRNQPLVATTRLLSPNGELFRIRNTVQVPARSTVENVEVYADQPSPEMEIGPTKFTIPGLSQSAQELIYAESSAAMTYRAEGPAVVSSEDINKAKEVLKAKLVAELKTKEEEAKASGYNTVKTDIDESKISYTTDVSAGTQREDFAMVATGTGIVVAFNTADIAQLAKLKLEETVPADKTLAGFNEENFSYEVERYDVAAGIADLKVQANAQMVLREGTDIIDPERLTGLTREQLNDYLSGLREVAGYDVTFSPNWINKMPSLVDHIDIEVAE